MSAGAQAVEAYLAKLPQGLASHPECKIKWSAVQRSLDLCPPGGERGLPSELVEFISRPHSPNEWVPEVYMHVWLVYAATQWCASEEAFMDHFIESNRQLFEHFAYRVMFRLVGPRKIISQAAARWRNFHQGTTLEPIELRSREAVLHHVVPANHCPEHIARAYAGAIIAGVGLAGAREVEVETRAQSPTLNVFTCRWR